MLAKMKKGLKALIPSVQYGNVTFETELTREFELSGDLKADVKTIREVGQVMDKVVHMEYNKFYDVMTDKTDTLTSLG